ncbi:MAG TPA: peptide chain release factor N(5)-glutamine methyltransferase [Arcobacter sp.]|nr:peptide chain release factor N(5)-glutamine methyltransferase [Arcobacter sp.]HIP55985.1 peptide chain release factor N(5)-glutamine methyltransferase [Arcobacter sp.]
MASYKQITKQYSQQLREVTHIPQKEVEILLLNILQQNIIWLHLNFMDECEVKVENELKQLVKKRATNYPLEYIIKKASFYGESFIVSEGVLIPRPETEILVEKAEAILKTIQNPKVVEVGVGSGIVSVMLALLIPDIEIIAVDINDKALELASKNAKKFQVEDKITFINSDIFTSIDVKNFDMCISNPPYIQSNSKLPDNVNFEPSNALYGGDIGDELLKNIANQTVNNNIKYLLCEMGYDQKASMQRHLAQFDTKSIEFYKDYDKFDRGFICEFKENKNVN